MSPNYLTLCVFLTVFMEVNGRVCTWSRSTHTATFTLSENVIKNKVLNTPTYEVVTKCCHGYRNVNPAEQPSSTNCLKICNMNCITETCKIDEHCVCPEGFMKDTTGTFCVVGCPAGYKLTGGECIKILEEYNSTNKTTEMEMANDKVNTSINCERILQYKSYAISFIVSAIVNTVFLLIIIIIVAVKYKNGVRDNKYVMPGCSNTHYLPMDGVQQRNCADPPQYETMQYAGAAEELRYDYVQTPLPIHRQKNLQVPHRGRSNIVRN